MVNNKKFINRLSIPALLLSLIVSSCSLDIEESDSLITEGESAIFNGIPAADAAGFVDQLYNNIRSQTETQENLYALCTVPTDELLVPTRGTDWGDNGVWRTLHTHTWGSTHNFIRIVWNDKNSAVLRASEILDPLSSPSTEEAALASFARAFNMWYVMDMWGQVPFRNPTDGPDVTPSVMSRSEAYDMIVADLENAIAGLPASNAGSSDKSRPVKATARFWLAKVKLNAAVYNGSYGANDLSDVISLVDAIEADGYSIVGGDYFGLFPGGNQSNADVIWSVTAGAGNRMWNGMHYHQGHPDNGGGGWNGFTTLAEFYDKFEGPAGDNVIGGGQEERRGYIHTTATVDEANQGFGFGFQLGQMVGWREGEAVELKDRQGNPLSFTKDLPGLVGNGEATGIRVLKYSPANGAYTGGVVMSRFADAHLMRAEAMLRDGDAAGALAEVNELRALRANTSALTALDEAELLDERARELYTEGWRRNDMIRFGVFKDAWTFKEANDGHSDLFPIPSSALLSNPGLVQNDGY